MILQLFFAFVSNSLYFTEKKFQKIRQKKPSTPCGMDGKNKTMKKVTYNYPLYPVCSPYIGGRPLQNPRNPCRVPAGCPRL